MKKLVTALTLVAFAMVSTPTVATASVAKGQKIYKKKVRKYCGFSGVRFAREHTQDEWEEIYDEGDFKSETKKICPKLPLKKIKRSWWDHLYEFTYEYGEGGSHVPKC
ncbi:MAG: hypothetical protein KC427_03125 [Sulfurovum sp.]|uniref:hypothetical protein n=1 Tax=Sulfurovum sp. TaxID=1969726 RepID=UPI002867C0E5|nr:hypothetical protein [Sulfurovum sp.]MCO4844991.1 hypothetical protein [Sulfurovum sp.]